MAREQEARVLIGDRERIAVDPIAGPELALEVRGPEVVRARPWIGDHAGVMRRAAAPTLLHQAVPREQIARGADRRPRDAGMARLEPLQQLLRSPVRMSAARRQQQLRHGLRDLVRAVMRRATPIPQRRPSAGVVAADPLVAGLPTDRVPRAQRSHVVQPEQMIIDKAFALFHG